MKKESILISRREFLKIAGNLVVFSLLPSCLKGEDEIIILHTNDMHSRVEPFPENHPKHGGWGGFAQLSQLVKEIRTRYRKVLLVDAGDFMQGTPYYNIFRGKVEVEMMNHIGYDAVCLGNHEFDSGVDALYDALSRAQFPVVVANYDVSNTPLNTIVKKYVVKDLEDVKVGITGCGVSPQGLIPAHLFDGVVWEPPLPIVDDISKQLKEGEGCDIVVCLSHLGFKDGEYNDIMLASNSRYIDVIIGGHSHTTLKEPHRATNKAGKDVYVVQAGWGTQYLGFLRIVYHRESLFTSTIIDVWGKYMNVMD